MGQLIYPLLVFVAMAAWSFFHSWLAALSTKRLARQIFGKGIARYYRLIFVVIAIVTLAPVLAMVVFLPFRVLWVIRPPWLYLSLFVQTLSLIGLLVTVFQTDVMAFAGLRQIRHPDAEEENALVTSGMYGIVRHPLYLFSILFFWLIPYMTDLILAFVLASTLYFLLGTIPEERKMVEMYGESYRRYREEVPWIIPGLKF